MMAEKKYLTAHCICDFGCVCVFTKSKIISACETKNFKLKAENDEDVDACVTDKKKIEIEISKRKKSQILSFSFDDVLLG